MDVSQKSFEQKTCRARHHIFFCKISTQLTCVLIVASMKRHKKAGRFLRANCCVGLKCTGAFHMGCSRCVCVCAYSSGGRGGGRERGGGVANSRDMREPRHTQKCKHIYKHTHSRIHLHTHTRTRSTPAQRNEQPCTGHEWNNF